MSRIRIAALWQYIRPVERFEQFADQVESLVWTATDYVLLEGRPPIWKW